ncbi:MAG: trehalose utilization protein ThuA [Clostridiales bacterium]|jgi:trehalose utilization protein|nr:trehalose utilization protein ThuA [Clostridiales bacterium]
MAIKVTVWNEFYHEQTNEKVKAIYPEGIHGCIAEFLGKEDDLVVRTATLEMPEHGLTQEVLDDTDVLVWWGHCRHGDVADEIVERVKTRVLEGMGFIGLHSTHKSKIFGALMGTHCSLRWREIAEKERIWVVERSHPITQGLPGYFELPHEEMYGERFEIPAPDELLMIGWFAGGEVFRSGITYQRGYGRIFYFQPGHETFPIYYDENVRTVIRNAVRWAAPLNKYEPVVAGLHAPEPLEKL